MKKWWIKKHGNVRTRLTVVDDEDRQRIRLRVTDPNGDTAYRRGQILTMTEDHLKFYYAPATRERRTNA